MKCLYCKLKVPNDANVCGYCGRDLTEQQKHRGKFTLSVICGGLPACILFGLLGIEATGTVILWFSVIGWGIIFLIFKLFFKGEFNKTGFI
jgi:uncharacterized protein (DUF983 family)